MCKVLYLAAEMKLPAVKWSKKPAFGVLGGGHIPAGVRKHFSLPHGVYVGTEGCACGFFWQEDGEYATREYDNEAYESMQALLCYLRVCLEQCSVVEAFGCWDREWEQSVSKMAVFSIAQLMESGLFSIPEQTRIRFVA